MPLHPALLWKTLNNYQVSEQLVIQKVVTCFLHHPARSVLLEKQGSKVSEALKL